jgi:CBS domain-containing protein
MIAGVMRLGDRPVRAVMTPRRQLEMVDLSTDADAIRATIADSVHSRLPAYDGVPDEILGVIQAKDLLDAYLRGGAPDIRDLVRPAPTVPDTADALDVVDIIKGSSVQMALVHDEYGHFEGIVTNVDILQAIGGDFRTDAGPREPDAVQRDDGSWLIAGSMPVDEMAERLAIAIPEERPITPPPASCSTSSAICRRSARARLPRAGASRWSISTAGASTGFWRGALPLAAGGGSSSRATEGQLDWSAIRLLDGSQQHWKHISCVTEIRNCSPAEAGLDAARNSQDRAVPDHPTLAR